MSEEQTISEQSEVVGPGAMLKAAREKAGLSKAEIADRLHLKVASIERLEADTYDERISSTFTKGYLRLYAKQLQISEAEIVAAYEQMDADHKEPARLQSFSRRVAKQTNDDRLMLVTYLVGFIVLALVVIWWWQKPGADTSAVLPAVDHGATANDPRPVAELRQPGNDAQPRFSDEQPATGTAGIRTTEGAATGQEARGNNNVEHNSFEKNTTTQAASDEGASRLSSPSERQQVSAPSQQNNAVRQTDELASANQSATEQSDAANLGDTPGTQTESSLAAKVQLVFTFAGDCWVNIVDGTGEAIAFGVKKSGRVMEINGVPPFDITLGAPDVVSITYAGEAVDMSGINPNRTAKFTLPRQT